MASPAPKEELLPGQGVIFMGYRFPSDQGKVHAPASRAVPAPRCPLAIRPGIAAVSLAKALNAATAPSPGCTRLSMYNVHVPWESPMCPSHARDPQPGNSAAALFLSKAFEPNPIGKGTGSSFSSPRMVLGDNQSPHRTHLLRRSGMSHRRCRRGWAKPMQGRRVRTSWYPARDLGARHVSQSY